MSRRSAEIDPAVGAIVSAIDASSAVPVSTQLRGALEFGIASGELPDGHRLPSVRALARCVGLSPVTVAGVYAALQGATLVEGRSGSGTFVRASAGDEMRRKLAELDRRVADLLAFGLGCGLAPADVALRVSMAQPARSRPVSILMVGNFPDATEGYAAEIRPHLRDADRIDAIVLRDLEVRGADGYDLIAAPRTLLARIAEVAPGMSVIGVTLIPSEATRVGLAALPPTARIVGYSIFPGFVPIMKAGIRRFAPHVADPEMVVRGQADEAARLAGGDVLIYASGAEHLRRALRPDQRAFEYRHTPDAQSVRDDLLPAVEACRRQMPQPREAAE